MNNLIQFLSPHLKLKTIIRLNYIRQDDYLEKIIVNKLGFIPISLNTFIKGENLILFNELIIYHNLNVIYIYHKENKNSIYFSVNKDKEKLFLHIESVNLKLIGHFKKIMKQFKSIFIDFYIDAVRFKYVRPFCLNNINILDKCCVFQKDSSSGGVNYIEFNPIDQISTNNL